MVEKHFLNLEAMHIKRNKENQALLELKAVGGVWHTSKLATFISQSPS